MTQETLGYYAANESKQRRKVRYGVVSLWLFAVAAALTVAIFIGAKYGITYWLHLTAFVLGITCMLIGIVIGFVGIVSRGRTWTAALGFSLNLILLAWWGLSVLIEFARNRR